MNPKRLIIASVLILVVFLAMDSTSFIVKEGQQGFITRFGKPVRADITEPGLYWKIPIVETFHALEGRYLAWEGYPNQAPTADKRYISVETFCRWRISNPRRFYEKVTDENGALSRISDVVDGAVRNEIAQHDLVEVVRSEIREVNPGAISKDDREEAQNNLAAFTLGRSGIVSNINHTVKTPAKAWGIEILDARIQRVNYQQNVENNIEKRMISERKRIADKLRSEGDGEAQRIAGERDQLVNTILSDAYRQEQTIRGVAEAAATRIYNDTYSSDPERLKFFRFMQTLETTRASAGANTTLILTTESPVLRPLSKSPQDQP